MMDQHQRYLNGGRISTTTCTAIPALKWPPTRNASLVPGYPGSSPSSISRAKVGPASFPSASVLLQCAVLRASPPAGAIARGLGKQQPIMRTNMHKKSRCSSRVNEGMMIIRRSAGGRQRTNTLSRKAPSPALEPACAGAATCRCCTAATTAASPARRQASFDATVVGLGDLRTTAHTNAKQPLYNFLARYTGADRRVGDAEYWRGLVEGWCEERGLGPVDLSTKQVSLYLRQMAEDPRLSRYYGVSMVKGCGALRFALEGRPFDWSRLDGDGGGSRLFHAGWRWTCVAPEKDGCRTFASCGRGANVEVHITKPSYAQVCEVAGVRVNGVDCTSFAAFKPTLDVGSFSNPAGLCKMLAAVSSVSLCEGFRKQHRTQDVDVTTAPATPAPMAGMAGFSSLDGQAGVTVGCNSSSSLRAVGDGTNEGPLVSAKLGVAGGNAVLWSSKCSRVLPARVAAAMNPPKEQKLEGAARRCSECSKLLLSGLLPRVTEGAGGAATGGTGGVAGGGCSSEEGEEVAAAADKEEKLQEIHESEEGAERRSHATVDSIRPQPSPAPCSDEQRREGSSQTLGVVLKRDVASTGGLDQATEDIGFAKPDSKGTRTTSSLCAEEGSARKRFKTACSEFSLDHSSARWHYPGRDGDVMVAALGLSTLRMMPPHRWALTSSGPGDNVGC
ncbi:expressed unknown protein [Ectocarpus siliculosus]|uniref:Uncharacterized protein n=1 Tax=Ectocarpus siliculosus TaxID=2880 RepID=D7G049_ECTSI|nr:expressed unknown protein [Ectocarpus siliculosus]|eukprot:CBJ32931.1 expressed unknown protein [Ectocarpus siliculosus]